MASRRRSSRAGRRASARANAKLTRDLERLAALAPGGSADRPITLDSPAQVETHAASMPCPLCTGALQVEEHLAETVQGHRLRIAKVSCTRCGSRRSIYFQLLEATLN